MNRDNARLEQYGKNYLILEKILKWVLFYVFFRILVGFIGLYLFDNGIINEAIQVNISMVTDITLLTVIVFAIVKDIAYDLYQQFISKKKNCFYAVEDKK